jgi:hypothetical protein
MFASILLYSFVWRLAFVVDSIVEIIATWKWEVKENDDMRYKTDEMICDKE